jgi:hypothetical protein
MTPVRDALLRVSSGSGGATSTKPPFFGSPTNDLRNASGLSQMLPLSAATLSGLLMTAAA